MGVPLTVTPPMRFEFATASRILFGPGVSAEVAPAAAALGKRFLLVTGASAGRAAPFAAALEARGLTVTRFAVSGEPTTFTVTEGVACARAAACEVVVAIGGGSVIDAGKAIAALLTNPGDLSDYLEIIGRAQPLQRPAAPTIAVPTTAGTGSEVTRNAVLAAPEQRVKVSLRDPSLLPRLAIVDPLLTHSMPPALTAGSGLDALTQVLEPYLSTAANPLTDALCREGLQRAARSLRRAYRAGDDAAAREDMALVSLFGGLALANARLGAVHGLAGPLGGMTAGPHGALCGRLLPFVFAANLHALRTREPASPALSRHAEVARLLTGNPAAAAEDGAAWLHELCAELSVPGLAAYGLRPDAFPAVIAAATRSSSMKGNPIPLTPTDLHSILMQSL